MMWQTPGMGYDQSITMFSPDGRLLQVEYAREVVRKGSTAVGIQYGAGVVLAADKRITKKVVVPRSIEKIFQVDEHIAVGASGMVADTRVLVDRMRVDAQANRTTYNEAIDVWTLAKGICDFMQGYIQYGGVRPFGVSLLIAGVDSQARLYETDPSGALLGYKATAIGEGRLAATEFFEEKYSDGMTKDEAIELALGALHKATDAKLTEETTDLATIDTKTRAYIKLSKSDLKRYISSALSNMAR